MATPDDLQALSAWKLHKLTGDKEGQLAIWVSGNWRLFFKFENGDVYVLDYGDYH